MASLLTDVKSEWLKAKTDNGWSMRPVSWWKRLPIIRHIRAIYFRLKVDRHNELCRSMGMIPTGYDEWVVTGIWIGAEFSD